MADPITPSPDAVDEAVFVAVATVEGDAEVNVLAASRPRSPATTEGCQRLSSLRRSERCRTRSSPRGRTPGPPPSCDVAREMRRVLARLVPALDGAPARGPARVYTREFLVSHRRGAGQLRQVAPIDLQFDRFSQVDRFIDDTWSRLHQLARSRPAVAQAVDGSTISGAIGVTMSEDARTILDRVAIEPLNGFVRDRLQADGSMVVPSEHVDTTLQHRPRHHGGPRDRVRGQPRRHQPRRAGPARRHRRDLRRRRPRGAQVRAREGDR
jgi:hypothetical protein